MTTLKQDCVDENHDEHLALYGECRTCGTFEDEEMDDGACHTSFITGGSDPSSTECDQPTGHYPKTPHEGPDPFGSNERVSWTGGGSVAGDPLPVHDVSWSQHPILDGAEVIITETPCPIHVSKGSRNVATLRHTVGSDRLFCSSHGYIY